MATNTRTASRRRHVPTWESDPRVPGGAYLCGYWQDTYTVESMFCLIGSPVLWLRVRWSDGHVTVHCTAWDARADRTVTA